MPGFNGGQSCQISALYRKRLRGNREKTPWVCVCVFGGHQPPQPARVKLTKCPRAGSSNIMTVDQRNRLAELDVFYLRYCWSLSLKSGPFSEGRLGRE